MLGNRAAIDIDEGLILALAVRVNTACHEFLAGTGRPENQQRMIGGRDAIDHSNQLAKRRRAAHEGAGCGFVVSERNDRAITHLTSTLHMIRVRRYAESAVKRRRSCIDLVSGETSDSAVGMFRPKERQSMTACYRCCLSKLILVPVDLRVSSQRLAALT